MSRNRMILTYMLGTLFGGLASSKPFLSDRWIIVTVIGACLCSLMWAAFEKLDQLKEGKRQRREETKPQKVEIEKTCGTCLGGKTIRLLRHGKPADLPCYQCKGKGWVAVKPSQAA